MTRSEWAKSQIDRIQGPVYAAKAKAAAKAKKRAMFEDYHTFNRVWRRLIRYEARHVAFAKKMGWEDPGPTF